MSRKKKLTKEEEQEMLPYFTYPPIYHMPQQQAPQMDPIAFYKFMQKMIEGKEDKSKGKKGSWVWKEEVKPATISIPMMLFILMAATPILGLAEWLFILHLVGK